MTPDWAIVAPLAAGILLVAAPRVAAQAAVRARVRGLTAPRCPAPGSPDAPDRAVELGVLLELLAAAIRAGTSVPRALEAVGHAIDGPDGAGLHRAGASLVLGAGWAEAWTDAPPRLAPIRDALRPAWEQGAAPGESLRVAGEHLRSEQQALARHAAARLAVHLVLPLGVCFLPAFLLIGLLPVLLSLGGGVLGR
jgi:pilus assembly protein TadC